MDGADIVLLRFLLEHIKQTAETHGAINAAAAHFGVSRRAIHARLSKIRQTSPLDVLDAVADATVSYRVREAIEYFY